MRLLYITLDSAPPRPLQGRLEVLKEFGYRIHYIPFSDLGFEFRIEKRDDNVELPYKMKLVGETYLSGLSFAADIAEFHLMLDQGYTGKTIRDTLGFGTNEIEFINLAFDLSEKFWG